MKKTKYLYVTAIVVVLGMTITSCDKFLDVNTNPTQLKTATTPQALTSAMVSMAFYHGSDLYLYSSLFSQQGAGSGVSGTQTRIYDQYVLTNTDVNNIYSAYYAGTLADLDYVKKQALKEGNPQFAGIARILEAFTFQAIVDAWGDVPYKDALKGVANVQPKFDASKEIYDSLFNLIDLGISNLAQTNVRAPGAEDLIYGGNVAKWEKFGNTLKMRLALHYANVDAGAKLNALITGVPAAKLFGANADNFQMAFENVTNRQNPIHQFEVSRQDYWSPSTIMVNMMNAKADPRRAPFFTPYPCGTVTAGAFTGNAWVGFASNSAQTSPNSRINTYLRGSILSDTGARTNSGNTPTAVAVTYDGIAPERMLTYAEYCFIRAEASLVYGASAAPLANAQAWYQAGITANMQDAGVSGANITTYITANGTLPGVTQAGDLQLIIEEKWVANYGICMEPWTDWRRTGFPTLAPSAAAVAVGNNVIPRILVYPLAEQQTNLANVPNRANMSSKSVFWDK